MDVFHGVSKQSTVTSKISWSQIKVTNIITMETFEILLELPKCDTEIQSEENVVGRLAPHTIATNIQFVKKMQYLQSAKNEVCL